MDHGKSYQLTYLLAPSLRHPSVGVRSLVAQMSWAENSQPFGDAPVQQLTGNQRGFNRLPHTYVISNEKPNWIQAEGHD